MIYKSNPSLQEPARLKTVPGFALAPATIMERSVSLTGRWERWKAWISKDIFNIFLGACRGGGSICGRRHHHHSHPRLSLHVEVICIPLKLWNSFLWTCNTWKVVEIESSSSFWQIVTVVTFSWNSVNRSKNMDGWEANDSLGLFTSRCTNHICYTFHFILFILQPPCVTL